MRRMGSGMSTCSCVVGASSRWRGIVHGAWIGANCTQYVSDESQPPGALLPRTRLWYLLTHARTCLGHNAERVQSVALRCEILLLC